MGNVQNCTIILWGKVTFSCAFLFSEEMRKRAHVTVLYDRACDNFLHNVTMLIRLNSSAPWTAQNLTSGVRGWSAHFLVTRINGLKTYVSAFSKHIYYINENFRNKFAAELPDVLMWAHSAPTPSFGFDRPGPRACRGLKNSL